MFKTETHLHTKNSSGCGWLFADEMVKKYYEVGYNTIVIADHFNGEDISWEQKVEKTLAGYKHAKQVAEKYNINVLMSVEMEFKKTRPNHYLLYGITEEFLFLNPNIDQMSIEEFSAIAKKNNLFIVQAHPFRNEACYPTPEFVDAIEIYNGNLRHRDHSENSLKIAEENNLKKTAGSDAHRMEDIGRSGIKTNREIKTIYDLIEAIQSGNLEIIYPEDEK